MPNTRRKARVTRARPADQIAKEFGRKLFRLMVDKQWNQSDLDRAAAKYMPNKKFGRDNVSGYVRGLRLPSPVRLHALARALDVPTDVLLPVREVPGYIEEDDEEIIASGASLKTVADGRVNVKINELVDFDTAMKIMALLKKDAEQ